MAVMGDFHMDTYRAVNTVNGKFYIGSTLNFERRKKEHLRSTEIYPFQNALRKNPSAFEWEVWSDDYDEPILEQALLDMWYGKECCYNLNPQAIRPPARSPESLRKSGQENVSKGRGCFSEEFKNSEKRKETYRKIGEDNVKFGRGFLSPEFMASPAARVQRLRASKRAGEVCSKPVKVTSPDGLETLFKSIAEASSVLGVSKITLSKYAKGYLNNPMKKGLAKGSSVCFVD